MQYLWITTGEKNCWTKPKGFATTALTAGRWQYCLAEGIDPNTVTPAALSGKKYPETSEGGADGASEAVVLNGDINLSSVATEMSGDFFGPAVDLSSQDAPNDFRMPRPANVQTLFPIDDIEAETCDEHLVAPPMVIRHCTACQDLRRANAA